METIFLNASADVGNSSTKIIVMDGLVKKARKQPTVISALPTIPKFEDDELNVLVANLHKNMVVHVTSRAISRNGLFAIGDVANIHGGTGFNIKHHNKSERDLTIIQPLSMIATSVIQNVFTKNGELPETIVVNMEYASLIPVIDYTKDTAKALEDRLIGNHILIVYVGENHMVTVDINVQAAKVVQEGIPAIYALVGGAPYMFKAYNERYGVEFTGRDFVGRKILFVDIGDGTVELIYVVDGKPVLTKSHGVRMGVGHASEKALLGFKNNNKFRTALTRSTFMDKVLNERDKWHDECNSELQSAVFEQEQGIYDTIIHTIEDVLLNDLDDVVVFGGGTNVFKDLENQLISYANQYKLRVLWIDGKDASLINVIGLDELNNKVFFQK